MRVLIVDDDELTAKVVANSLTQRSYAVDVATDGQIGWQFVKSVEYNLILLDITMPKLDGLSFCRRLRQGHHQVPVLFLTARNTTHDRVIGLDSGADDYVTKPFELQELMARIRALLRRGSSSLPPVLEWGSLRLDPSNREVSYKGKPLTLTPKEYGLLKFFLHNSNHVLSRGTILDHLWTFDNPPEEDTVRSHIKGLRRKFKSVEMAADPIETVYGLGYRLKPLSHEEKNSTLPSVKPKEGWTEQQVTRAVTQIWQRYKSELYNCIVLLEWAITALRQNMLDDELRLRAEQAAHKLAGSLGTFGFIKETQLCWELESLFQSKVFLDPAQVQRLSRLVEALRHGLKDT